VGGCGAAGLELHQHRRPGGGRTAQLDEIGKIILSGCMFAGRVGPLTLFLLLPGRSGQKPIGLPEEEVAVG
jgi:hypothetical protein